jgi:acetyl esterase/lipase
MTRALALAAALVASVLSGSTYAHAALPGPATDAPAHHQAAAHPNARSAHSWSTRSISTGPRKFDRVDIYAPTGSGKHPAMLFVHGGGWVIDTIDKPTLKYFKETAKDQGWVLGIAYYPTKASGGRSVRTVEKNAVSADLDALRAQADVNDSKVAIYGQSAGGQLGGLIAYQHPNKVAAIVDSSGPSNMIVEDNSEIASDVEHYEGETYTKSHDDHDSRYARTSPVSYVGRRTPPTFSFSDKKDPLVPSTQFREFRHVLAHSSVTHQVLVMPGSTHCPEFQIVPGTMHTAGQEAIAFIKRAERNS